MTYQKYDQITHVLKKPTMYIGDTSLIEKKDFILESNTIVEKQITINLGLYKLFDEILMNAYDEAMRDSSLTFIKVTITNTQFTVENDGQSIDTTVHSKYKIHIPELIFGNLLTSSNYNENEKRLTAGTHGLGAKLTAIFSKEFIIDIGDPKNKQKYVQIFKNNLKQINKPKITSYNGKGYVKITSKCDFKYFNLEEFSMDMIKFMSRRVYDIAAQLKHKLYLNDKLIEMKSYKNYINYILKDNHLYESNSRWKIIITKSNEYKCMSFVNGVYTMKGGRHVDYILHQIITPIIAFFEKRYKTKLNPAIIKNNLFIVLFAQIENAAFSSQSKEELVTHVKDLAQLLY